jgi:RNA polymerase sigma-70 factor (ECF subfamily)
MAGETPQPASGDESAAVSRDARLATDAVAAPRSAHPTGAAQSTIVLSALDDATLVERAKTDPEAFGVLYERHARSVFAFAFSKVRDAGVAEDLTSQTFLQALRALPRYEQRGAPFRSWLFRIASNLVADRHRAPVAEVPMRRRATEGEESEEIDPVDPRAEEDITSWERAQAFARLVENLTPEQRTVVHLRFVDGLPIAAIASHMSRSEGSIKMLLMRALQNLRRTIALETMDAG